MEQPSLDMHRLFNLDRKVALVTGGSRGIGFMISQGLGAVVPVDGGTSINHQHAQVVERVS